MRIAHLILISLLSLLLSSCALLQRYTVEQTFKKGDYLSGITLLAHDMDQKSLPLSDWNAKYLLQTVNNLTQIAEKEINQSAPDNYASRIDGYKILLAIKTQLGDKPYGKILESFNQHYTAADLKQQLVTQYYDYAQNYAGSNSAAYKRKAELYKEGMTYDLNYKDIAKQYQTNLNKYYLIAAKEYYAAGSEYVRQENYKAAAESFAAAEAVYRPLGHYKDSQALAKRYDKKYRTIEAGHYYTQAQQLGVHGANKSVYRTMASYYQQAADIYQPYGQYKDAASLATKYQQLGQIHIYIVNRQFDDVIKSELRQDYIDYVDCLSCADITINIFVHHHPDYDEDHGREQTSNKYEKIITGHKQVTKEDGTVISVPEYQEYSYTLHSRTERNSLKLTASLETRGLSSDTHTYSGSASSEITYYWYSGNVPPGKYHPHTSGRLLSRTDLYHNAYKDMIRDLKYDLFRMNSSLDTL